MGQTYKLNAEQRAEAVRLYGEGWSAQQIANRYDVTKCSVQNALKFMGVKSRTANEGREVARSSGYRAYLKAERERKYPQPPLAQVLSTWRTQ